MTTVMIRAEKMTIASSRVGVATKILVYSKFFR